MDTRARDTHHTTPHHITSHHATLDQTMPHHTTQHNTTHHTTTQHNGVHRRQQACPQPQLNARVGSSKQLRLEVRGAEPVRGVVRVGGDNERDVEGCDHILCDAHRRAHHTCLCM
eukprot:1563163-Rhodomonas_salina.1